MPATTFIRVRQIAVDRLAALRRRARESGCWKPTTSDLVERGIDLLEQHSDTLGRVLGRDQAAEIARELDFVRCADTAVLEHLFNGVHHPRRRYHVLRLALFAAGELDRRAGDRALGSLLGNHALLERSGLARARVCEDDLSRYYDLARDAPEEKT